MLRDFFKSKRTIQLDRVRAATADIERFILSLKGMSDQEIGTVVALAAVIRMELRQQNLFPDAALGVGMPLPEAAQTAVRANMVRMVIDCQKRDGGAQAGAAMVWAHSLRALQFPEVRLLGREMWGQLERGFPHVFDAFRFFETTVKQPVPLGALQASQFIPIGLEPAVKV